MPKIEYGVNETKMSELKSELERLKSERVSAFIDGDATLVEYYTTRMAEISSALEAMNVLGD